MCMSPEVYSLCSPPSEGTMFGRLSCTFHRRRGAQPSDKGSQTFHKVCTACSTIHTSMPTGSGSAISVGGCLNPTRLLLVTSGDVSKIPFPSTNHQAAYTAHVHTTNSPNYTSRRAQALAQIHGSSIQPCDPRINPFQPSPPPHPSSLPVDSLPAAGHPPVILQADMMTSHFPQGDLNALRAEERINHSTTQRSHKPVSVRVLVSKCTCVHHAQLQMVVSVVSCRPSVYVSCRVFTGVVLISL